MKFSFTAAMCAPSEYVPLARAAEAAGFHSLNLPDSVFYPMQVSASYPYTHDGRRFWNERTPFVDPWVAIPAMASATVSLKFFTMVLKLPIRQPLLVAKTVSSAAAMFEGRIALGVGTSWIPQEFEWLGSEYSTRGERMAEAVAIIRQCLSGGVSRYQGRFYWHDDLVISPAPVESVPIYFGGTAKPALRRAAKVADGWISPPVHGDEALGMIELLKLALKEAGRQDVPFEFKVMPNDPGHMTKDGFRRLSLAGVTEIIVLPWACYGIHEPSTLDVKLEYIEKFGADVIGEMC